MRRCRMTRSYAGDRDRGKKNVSKTIITRYYYRYWFFFSLGGDSCRFVLYLYARRIIYNNTIPCYYNIYTYHESRVGIGATINDRDYEQKQKNNNNIIVILYEKNAAQTTARSLAAGGKHRGSRIININTYLHALKGAKSSFLILTGQKI